MWHLHTSRSGPSILSASALPLGKRETLSIKQGRKRIALVCILYIVRKRPSGRSMKILSSYVTNLGEEGRRKAIQWELSNHRLLTDESREGEKQSMVDILEKGKKDGKTEGKWMGRKKYV